MENEADLVLRAKDDDRAFEVLYNYYYGKLYGYIFKRTGRREVAEDIISDVFMKAFTNMGKYEHRGYSFGAWLYRIATNHLIDHYRKQGRASIQQIDDFENVLAAGENSFDIVNGQLNKELIEKVIKKLPERYQKIINLKYFAQLGNNEIAESMRVSANNVGVLHYRAIKSFQKYYQKEVGVKIQLKIDAF